MKIYHVLFLVWVLIATIWAINQVSASHRRKNGKK